MVLALLITKSTSMYPVSFTVVLLPHRGDLSEGVSANTLGVERIFVGVLP